MSARARAIAADIATQERQNKIVGDAYERLERRELRELRQAYERRVLISAAFTASGEIIGAVCYRNGRRMAQKAERTLREEIAPRRGLKIASYSTLDLSDHLEAGQLIELDMGHDIVHEAT